MNELPSLDDIQNPTARAFLSALLPAFESLQETIQELTLSNEKLRAENEELKRALFGRKTEKMPPISRELKKRAKAKDPEKAREAIQKKRKARRQAKKKLPTEEVIHPVEKELCCPHCQGTEFLPLGEGEESFEYEFVPSRLIRRRHVRQKMVCSCGEHVVTAPGPSRVVEGGEYGPGLYAQVVVSKCADSIPCYRQAKQFERAGIPIGRSTLTELFHRTASLLKPLWLRMLELLAKDEKVNADETPMPVQQPGKTHRGYIWTFIAGTLLAFVFSKSRSSSTPQQILGETTGTLQIDGYAGYNKICTPEQRERVACLAHVRRYFFKALSTAEEEARWVLAQILKLYEVEYEAAEEGILGSERHLALRRVKSKPLMEEWHDWLEVQQPQIPPKSPLGVAINHTLKSWKELNVFLTDAGLSLDNNISERALRPVALGRKNFLFVGNEEAGENLAILQSLVSTCQANGVNSQDYLSDVLIRIQTHPNSRIDELLPHNWKPLNS